MGTHLIPRSNVKGQDRFFIIFSIPGLIGTIAALLPGFVVYSMFKLANGGETSVPGLVVLGLFGFVGFVIGQVQVPDNGNMPILKKIGGLYIRDVISQYFSFKKKKKKYVIQISDEQAFEESTASKATAFLLNKDKK